LFNQVYGLGFNERRLAQLQATSQPLSWRRDGLVELDYSWFGFSRLAQTIIPLSAIPTPILAHCAHTALF
jgi:hypothetical protein